MRVTRIKVDPEVIAGLIRSLPDGAYLVGPLYLTRRGDVLTFYEWVGIGPDPWMHIGSASAKDIDQITGIVSYQFPPAEIREDE